MVAKLIRTHEIQNFLATRAGQFVSVEFIKKDGTMSRKVLQPASAKFHRVAKPTPAGKKAAQTRAKNNLSLVNHRTAKGNFFSFRLEAVRTLVHGGTTYLVVD